MAARGKLVALLGALLLGGTVVLAGWSVFTHKAPACTAEAAAKGAPPGAIVYAPEKEIAVNGYLCLAWQPKELFKDELAAKAVLDQAVESAEGDEGAIRDRLKPLVKPKDDAAITAANTELTQVQARVTDAKARLKLSPQVATLRVFIDGAPTPITLDAAIVDKPGWATVSRRLRVPEDAKSDDAKAWRALLSGGGDKGLRAIKVSLGDKDAKLPRDGTDIADMQLRILEPFWVLLGAASFFVMTLGLVMWGWNTGMLRERTPTSEMDKPPFSLGRTQMAWWFFLSLGGFLFIWLLTGQSMSVLTMSVVALVGISGVSGAAAVAIDNLPADPNAPQPATPPQTQGFFKDLTSGGDGVVLHRVQMLAWTVVMGLIFAWNVAWNFAFPEFDTAMLVLAGVVNSVYVGFKFPEKAA